MKALAFWLPVLLLPYWLGPIVVWLTQRWSVRPDFERFDPIRHRFDADLITGFERSRDALLSWRLDDAHSHALTSPASGRHDSNRAHTLGALASANSSVMRASPAGAMEEDGPTAVRVALTVDHRRVSRRI